VTFDAGGASAARDVSRDANGNVEFTSAGTSSVTGVTQTGVTNTTTVSGTGRVMYDKFQGGINAGTADLSLLRNGNFITSETGVTSGDGIFVAGTPRASSPNWTAKFNWNSIGNKKTKTGEFLTLNYSGNSTSITALSGNGSTISMGMTVDFYAAGGTFKGRLKRNGNTFYTYTNTQSSNTLYISGSTKGSFTDSNVTWTISLTNAAGFPDAYGTSGVASLKNSVAGTLTASKNKVTTVS